MTTQTIELPITSDDRDDTLTVTFAVWKGDHPGQSDTLEIEHAKVNSGDMPGLWAIEAMVWAWLKREREAV